MSPAGKPAVLVASEKLASLAPPTSAIKDERKKEAAQRYSIAAYHWSPDSKKLLFDSMGQLWLYTLESGTAVQITSSAEPPSIPSFRPTGAAFRTSASTISMCGHWTAATNER